MRPSIEVTRTGTINAAPEKVWATIADFGSAHTYFPSIVECTLVGSGIGARRHLVTDDGGTTISELIELDDAQMAMGYRVIESSVPIEDYSSRLVVRPAARGCEVTYSSRCQVREGTEPADLESFLAAQLDSAIGGLREIHVSESAKKAKPSTPTDDDDDEGDVEGDVEELAGLFGVGPKAAPAPDGPIEGEQYAP
ncbi:MAG: SRPBCC family protein [Acidimicrobiales bacterium]